MISDYAANAFLDAILSATSFAVNTPYASLHSDNPGGTGANEATGGSYGRENVTGLFNSASSRATDNDTAIPITAPAGTWTHFGIWDASSSGNFIIGGRITSGPHTTTDGQQIEFAIGDMDFFL
jgi:hypothetical protein